jgi:heme-degrading monooxygenase HmoA
MHGRVARYTNKGDAHAIARRAEEGLLPILQSQPGFKGYSVVEAGGEIISFSAWDSEANADAVNSVAAEWVAENVGDDMELIDARGRETLFSTTLAVSTKTGATA